MRVRALQRSRVLKLIAVDLDGTLLGPKGVPHLVDVEALKAASAAGLHVVIITGRMYSGSLEAIAALGLTGPVCCVDGAQIVEAKSGLDLRHLRLGGQWLSALRQGLQRQRLATYLLHDDHVVHDEQGRSHLEFLSVWSKRHQPTGAVLEHAAWEHPRGVTGVITVGAREEIEAAMLQLVDAPVSKLVFTTPGGRGLWGAFVRAQGSDKGLALRWVADYLGVPLEQTMAIGDWLNDVPMLEIAGRSFAMAHAPHEVLKAAREHVPQHGSEGGGIAHALKLVFG